MTEEIKGMIATVNGQYAIMTDPANGHYGWCFSKHPDGMWVSMRVATTAEMSAALRTAEALKVPAPVMAYEPQPTVAWRYKTGSGRDEYEFTKYQLDHSFRLLGAGEHEYIKGEELIVRPKQGTLFTCIGKGGTYEDMGVAIGAGTSKGDLVQVYRDTATGQLYFREPEDFIDRMEVVK